MSRSFLRFCGPQIIETNLSSLCGLLEGMLADDVLNKIEADKLMSWFNDNRTLSTKQPFEEIYHKFQQICSDGKIEKEEIEDLLWLCSKLKKNGAFYNDVTKDIQFLHGLVAGISSDNKINEQEIATLKKWCLDHEHLKGMWPYDEFYSLCLVTLEDGIITEQEKEIINFYFKEFLNLNGNNVLNLPLNESEKPITGVCAVCPEITFEYKKFVITGESEKISRSELTKLIEECSGEVQKEVTQKTDYLIVLSKGSPAWTYKAYGRKVEYAIHLRKKGFPVVIVHEGDLWEALRDADVA
jgi:NAD-dependent DNA ligase